MGVAFLVANSYKNDKWLCISVISMGCSHDWERDYNLDSSYLMI